MMLALTWVWWGPPWLCHRKMVWVHARGREHMVRQEAESAREGPVLLSFNNCLVRSNQCPMRTSIPRPVPASAQPPCTRFHLLKFLPPYTTTGGPRFQFMNPWGTNHIQTIAEGIPSGVCGFHVHSKQELNCILLLLTELWCQALF